MANRPLAWTIICSDAMLARHLDVLNSVLLVSGHRPWYNIGGKASKKLVDNERRRRGPCCVLDSCAAAAAASARPVPIWEPWAPYLEGCVSSRDRYRAAGPAMRRHPSTSRHSRATTFIIILHYTTTSSTNVHVALNKYIFRVRNCFFLTQKYLCALKTIDSRKLNSK